MFLCINVWNFFGDKSSIISCNGETQFCIIHDMCILTLSPTFNITVHAVIFLKLKCLRNLGVSLLVSMYTIPQHLLYVTSSLLFRCVDSLCLALVHIVYMFVV